SHFWDNHIFDLWHGTDTAHWKPREAYTGVFPNHGYHYEASHTSQIARCLKAVNKHVRFAEYSFFDLGWGKGKVLLCADRFGFAQIIGVEYDRSLAEIARANIVRVGASATVVCADVAEFDAYAARSILYLYNPFDELVLDRILQQVEGRVE